MSLVRTRNGPPDPVPDPRVAISGIGISGSGDPGHRFFLILGTRGADAQSLYRAPLSRRKPTIRWPYFARTPCMRTGNLPQRFYPYKGGPAQPHASWIPCAATVPPRYFRSRAPSDWSRCYPLCKDAQTNHARRESSQGKRKGVVGRARPHDPTLICTNPIAGLGLRIEALLEQVFHDMPPERLARTCMLYGLD